MTVPLLEVKQLLGSLLLNEFLCIPGTYMRVIPLRAPHLVQMYLLFSNF